METLLILLACLAIGATVRFGQGVSDIAGSIGGTVFSRNASGAYIRNRSHPTNPQTPLQTLIRSAFGSRSTGWRALTDDNRNSWIAAATGPLGQRTNKLGEVIQLTGFQLYNSINAVRSLFALAPLPNAPASPSSMAAITATTQVAEVTVATGAISALTISPTLSLPASDMIIYASPPLPAGRSRSASATYKLLDTLPAQASGLGINVLAAYQAVHGTPSVAVGNVIWFRMSPAVSTTGVVGAEVTLKASFVADV